MTADEQRITLAGARLSELLDDWHTRHLSQGATSCDIDAVKELYRPELVAALQDTITAIVDSDYWDATDGGTENAWRSVANYYAADAACRSFQWASPPERMQDAFKGQRLLWLAGEAIGRRYLQEALSDPYGGEEGYADDGAA